MFHDEPLHSALGAPRLAFPGAAPVEEMPIRDFLATSAYYPAAGTDLWPVLALADVCSTFVFADYCVSAEDAVAALERLHPGSIRDVTSRALLPGRRWVPGRYPRCCQSQTQILYLPHLQHLYNFGHPPAGRVRPSAPSFLHQSFTRLASPTFIFPMVEIPKADANPLKLARGPFTQYSSGECGSVATKSRRNSSLSSPR